jgi:hypothetical protein
MGMDSVFLLWHVHELPDQEDDEKLIGVYRTEADAEAAVLRLKDRPGFCEAPEGFLIDKYELNRDNWTEGYITTCSATRQ